MELFGVVDVNGIGQARGRPSSIYAQSSEPSILRLHDMLDGERDRRRGRRLQRQIETGDHAACDVDRQS